MPFSKRRSREKSGGVRKGRKRRKPKRQRKRRNSQGHPDRNQNGLHGINVIEIGDHSTVRVGGPKMRVGGMIEEDSGGESGGHPIHTLANGVIINTEERGTATRQKEMAQTIFKTSDCES